jgi:branched-subunit amino acid aminotransferase/4-amino-4-deoxychorismate lyase
LERLRIADRVSLQSIRNDIEQVASRNFRLIPGNGDLGICVVVSPGSVESFVPDFVDRRRAARPKWLVHSFPLPLGAWRTEFELGVRLAKSNVREAPDSCFPKNFKHRSRLNYFLAQQEVIQRSPGCRALLETLDGHVADSGTAGILMFDPQAGWIGPCLEDALHSVSVAVVEKLVVAAGMGFCRRKFSVREVVSVASEVIWCSTPCGILPVIEIDGSLIGGGTPGPEFLKLSKLWSDEVGFDYRHQGLQAAAKSL